MKPRDRGGVVDTRLNVYGVQNLKVADMSICPSNVASVSLRSPFAQLACLTSPTGTLEHLLYGYHGRGKGRRDHRRGPEDSKRLDVRSARILKGSVDNRGSELQMYGIIESNF